jgi:hypothetical protein
VGVEVAQTPKKKRKKKPKDFPTQPRTAYNFFFRHRRAMLLGEDLPAEEDAASSEAFASSSPQCQTRRRRRNNPHRRISFADMGTLIGKEWNVVGSEERAIYQEQADRDKKRYFLEKQRYLQAQINNVGAEQEAQQGEPTLDEDNDDRKRAADEGRNCKERKGEED